MTSVDSQPRLANSLCLRLEDAIGAVSFGRGAVLLTRILDFQNVV